MSEYLDRTKALPTEPVQLKPPKQRKPDFQPGKAQIPPARPAQPAPPPSAAPPARRKIPLNLRLKRLKAGGGWTVAGTMVLLICWGLWASDNSGDLGPELQTLALILLVALGLFVVSRIAGGFILERVFGRQRRGAILSHLAIGLFLTVTGLKLAGEVQWVITALNHLRGIR